MNMFESEADLAKVVISWLEAHGWDVFQEVQPDACGPIADIVGVQSGISWVIETKRAFGKKLLSQAATWQLAAHHVSVAVPWPRRALTKAYMDRLKKFEETGVGVLQVHPRGTVSETLAPQVLGDPAKKTLAAVLSKAHKQFAQAGHTGSKQLTPCQATMALVRRILVKNGRMSMNALMDEIDGRHHCASENSAKARIRHEFESRFSKNLAWARSDWKPGKGNQKIYWSAPEAPPMTEKDNLAADAAEKRPRGGRYASAGAGENARRREVGYRRLNKHARRLADFD